MNAHNRQIWLVAAAVAVSGAFSAAAAHADPQFRPGGSGTAVLTCSSNSYEKVWCELQGDDDIVDASVRRRMSNAGCDRRDDWDVDNGSLWVRNGCRADFEVIIAGPAFGPDDELAGGPGGYIPPAGSYGDRDDRGHERNDRDEAEDHRILNGRLAQSIAACSREANIFVQDRGAWSAQYADSPRLVETRGNYELRGRMRIHDDRGFHIEDSRCQVRRGDVVDFQMR